MFYDYDDADCFEPEQQHLTPYTGMRSIDEIDNPIDFAPADDFLGIHIPSCVRSHSGNHHDLDFYDTANPSISRPGHGPTSDGLPASFSSVEIYLDLLNKSSLEESSPYVQVPDEVDTGLKDRLNGELSSSWASQSDHNLITGQFALDPGAEFANSAPRPFGQPSLPRRRSQYLISKMEGKVTPMYIPNAVGLDPMQRWQESPPEDEPASIVAIQNAMEETLVKHGASRQKKTQNPGSAFNHYRRPASTTSQESSASSTGSAWSSSSCSSRVKKRRARTGVPKSNKNNNKRRMFCCTFCCDCFGTRYEWVRHEKSLHLNLETWYCTPLGPSVFSSVTGKPHCAYCNAPDPTENHLSEHNYETCQALSKDLCSFRRKDHLVQHLRHVHHVRGSPLIDDWKVETKNVTSRCGFCDTALESWDERVEHLARHFRTGCTMRDWKGDHGFPPCIAAQLQNAYPPYLLGWESGSIIPFSATDKDVRDHYAQVMFRASGSVDVDNNNNNNMGSGSSNVPPSDATKSQPKNFLDVFTRHLSHYAREQMRRGIIPTDEMFQQESRRVLFDSEDTWNQTIADSPDWLLAFRRLHCDPEKNLPTQSYQYDHDHEPSPNPED
ncbi:hypothetical protein FE257_008538 [Aspergillus nanangensis]|uniref:C2H2-type domain-containing protein n=1 Tax=Aspergillus nanangensis TaxID=2582783 RepID=A0AAD4CLD0_ASPNN|nr:hypothetical protein FE257_008538 [Aspergillus nanangensis]